MIAFVRKNLSFLIWKHSSPFVCRLRSPIFSLPPSLPAFSTSTERKLCNNPTLLYILVRKYEFSPELASRVVSELSHLKNSENVDLVLSFFRQSGFSNPQLVKIASYRPLLLTGRIEYSYKPKIKILQDVGFSSKDITKIISRNPAILRLSVKNNIIPSISFLKGLLGSVYKVANVLSSTSWILSGNLENILIPNVEFLKSCGIPIQRIRSAIASYPGSFAVKPEIIRKCAAKAEEMGVYASSNKYIYAIATFASMGEEAWELKLQGFRNLGFSESDIVAMFNKEPRVFMTSIEKVKKVKDLLLATGKFDISNIVNSPLSLAFSVEMRYKPRLQILSILESRNLIRDWPSLGTLTSMSNDAFLNKFGGPYSEEVTDVCLIKRFTRGRKVKKP